MAIRSHWGWTPNYAYLNAGPKKKVDSLDTDSTIAKLQSRSAASLQLAKGEENEAPYLDLPTLGSSAFMSRMWLVVPAENVDLARAITWCREIVRISDPRYLRCHDSAELHQIDNQRNRHLLFVPGMAYGAYSLTYFCQEYVERLGGAKQLAAPPWVESHMLEGGGMLLVADDVQACQEHLLGLVKPEERV
jgi:hypothetical protein